MELYDTIKQVLRDALKDPDFVRKNTLLLNDPTLVAEMQLRVDALTSDLNVTLSANNVLSTKGLLTLDSSKNQIVFDPSVHTSVALTSPLLVSPGQIAQRAPADAVIPPTDHTYLHSSARYALCDASSGVHLLDENNNLVMTWPNYNPTGITLPTDYATPQGACFFWLNGTEYLAIACGLGQCVQIYNFATMTLFLTVGIPNTPGLPTDLVPGLTNPVSVTYDATRKQLYIACKTGTAPGATGSFGFVAAQSFGSIFTLSLMDKLRNVTNGSLLRAEVKSPSFCLFSLGLLWIANGNGEIGGFDPAASILRKYISSSVKNTGNPYLLGSVPQFDIKSNMTNTPDFTPAFMQSGPCFPLALDPVALPSFKISINGQIPFTNVFSLKATPAILKNSPNAQYTAVPAFDHLDLLISVNPDQDPVLATIAFTGAENTQASFVSAISAGLVGLGTCVANADHTLSVLTAWIGSGASIQVMPSSSASVLQSLALQTMTVTSQGPNDVFWHGRATSDEFGAMFARNVSAFTYATSYDKQSLTLFAKDNVTTFRFLPVASYDIQVIWDFNYFSHTPSKLVSGYDYRLFVANSDYGNILEFNLLNNALVNTYGARVYGLPGSIFPNAGSVNGLVASSVGSYNSFLITDSVGIRAIEIGQDGYNPVNTVVFNPVTFKVPVRVKSWSLSGDVASSAALLEYQNAQGSWTVLEPDAASEPVTSLALRLTVTLGASGNLQPSYIKRLVLVTEQE
jgi:hypothetical protein